MTQQPEPIILELNPDQGCTEIESVCMNCRENGVTRLLLTKIPYFREVIIMAFECPHCGFRNNEVQSASEISETGIHCTCQVKTSKDLSRQVLKAETATARIDELDFEIPAGAQRGVLTTIEGILTKAIEGLSQEQPVRKYMDENLYNQIQAIIDKLTAYRDAKEPFTFILDDPTGNSFLENLNAPAVDPQLEVRHYVRSKEQNEALGVVAAANPEVEKEEEQKKDDINIDVDEVMHFDATCPSCKAPCSTRMHLLNIPHFKEVVIMATTCDSCGYKSNEVKAGGAIAPKGKKITLKMTDEEDLSRDILKSETCALKIPEINLELTYGTLGGRFTTIEGLLDQIYDELDTKTPFTKGDSVTPERKHKFADFLQRLDEVKEMKREFTLILDDPLANSYLQNIYAPDPDPNMTIEEYERTFQQNEDFGINDMVVENYNEKGERLNPQQKTEQKSE
jgi:zinc finger protein